MKLKSIVVSVGMACAVASGSAGASGFALIEEGASGLGNAYAGGTAVAADATTIYYNPAGMSRLHGTNFSIVASGIQPSAKFTNGSSVAAPLQPSVGGTGGDAGSLVWVPNAYISTEINPELSIGLGINAPFGLETSYDPSWMGRFQAIKSKLQTVNLNPSVAYRINDSLSVGAGLNYQRITGNLTSAVNYSAAAFSAGGAGLLGLIGGPGVEGISTITGSDNAWGYNLGLLFNPSPQTRVGLAYRSTVNYTLNGTVTFSNRPAVLAGAIPDGPVSLAIKMPDSFSASVFHKMDGKWDVMADLTWTGWSVFQQLNIVRANGQSLQNVQENWKDTWRVSVGSNYHYSQRWMARIGVAFDQAPVSDAYRTVRIPDGNRTWLALGGQYKPDEADAFDFAYAHLFVGNVSINQPSAANGTVNGSYNDSVDIVSVQYSHRF